MKRTLCLLLTLLVVLLALTGCIGGATGHEADGQNMALWYAACVQSSDGSDAALAQCQKDYGR